MDYLWPCLVFVWVAFLWETYLQWRQRHVYRTVRVVPSELEGKIDQETFDKSRLYQLDKSTFSMTHNLFKELEFLVFIIVGAIPYAWHSAGSITAHMGYGEEYEVIQTVVFLLLVLTYSTITEMPWSVYSTFVLEEKHGFNKQTVKFFIKDKLKGFILLCLLVPPILAGLVAVIQWGGEYFYIYAWVFIFIISLTWVMVYHDYIAPFFDKFTPLPAGELRSSIEGLASSLQFPLRKILVVEGSKRSAHSNAYFYGFWRNKRIVLFDTLLEEGIMPVTEEREKEGKEKEEMEDGKREDRKEQEEDGKREDRKEQEEDGKEQEEDGKEQEEDGKEEVEEGESERGEEGVKEDDAGKGEAEKIKKKGCTMEEILAVLAHELGHWKLSHNLKNICIAELNFFLTLFMFGYFLHQQDVYTSFGFPSSRPTIIGLILVFQLIFIPYHEVFGFLFTQLIRRFEYQADAFAQQLKRARALRSALTKLYKDNLAFPIADPLYSAFHLSHPTYLERIQALQDKKQE